MTSSLRDDGSSNQGLAVLVPALITIGNVWAMAKDAQLEPAAEIH